MVLFLFSYQKLQFSSLPTYNLFLCFLGRLLYLRSKRGLPVLVYQNYLYRIDKYSGNTTFWRCKQSSSLKCKARCITKNDRVAVRERHCHLPLEKIDCVY